MAYAIARVAKLKKANIVSSGAHTSRSKEDIPNADPTKKNIRFIGDTNSEKNLEQIVLDKINQHFPEVTISRPENTEYRRI